MILYCCICLDFVELGLLLLVESLCLVVQVVVAISLLLVVLTDRETLMDSQIERDTCPSLVRETFVVETLGETLVPSEPQQGMLHQGTNRDGEVFPVASGRRSRSVQMDKVAPCPSEGNVDQ